MLPPGESPRLIEFARFGMAIAQAMNHDGNDFLKQFIESRQEAIARTIDASPVASALIDWFEQRKMEIILPAKDLFSQVECYRPQGTDAWPKSAKGFADALRRVAPALRQLGIECRCLGKQGSHVKWRIAPREKLPNSNLQCLDILPQEDMTTLKTSNLKIPRNDSGNLASQRGLGSGYSGLSHLNRHQGAIDSSAEDAYRRASDGE